jgi:hypothetical protein
MHKNNAHNFICANLNCPSLFESNTHLNGHYNKTINKFKAFVFQNIYMYLFMRSEQFTHLLAWIGFVSNADRTQNSKFLMASKKIFLVTVLFCNKVMLRR